MYYYQGGTMEQPYTKSLSGLCLCLNNVRSGRLLIGEREMQANKALQMQIKLCSCQNPEITHSRPAHGLQRGIL